MENDKASVDVKFMIEDFAGFVIGLGIFSTLESSLPLVCDSKGMKMVTMIKDRKKEKEHSVYVTLTYPRSNLLQYALQYRPDEESESEWIGTKDQRPIVYRSNLDLKALLEKTKGLAKTDTFTIFTNAKEGQSFYSINEQGRENLPQIHETGNDVKAPVFSVDYDDPLITISKKEYTNLCGRLKTLKVGTAQVRAVIYSHGLKLLFKNYADPHESFQSFGDVESKPESELSVDLRALTLPASKLKLMVPDRAPIKLYYVNKPHPGLLISIPVGVCGYMEILSLSLVA